MCFLVAEKYLSLAVMRHFNTSKEKKMNPLTYKYTTQCKTAETNELIASGDQCGGSPVIAKTIQYIFTKSARPL